MRLLQFVTWLSWAILNVCCLPVEYLLVKPMGWTFAILRMEAKYFILKLVARIIVITTLFLIWKPLLIVYFIAEIIYGFGKTFLHFKWLMNHYLNKGNKVLIFRDAKNKIIAMFTDPFDPNQGIGLDILLGAKAKHPTFSREFEGTVDIFEKVKGEIVHTSSNEICY